MSSSDTKRYRIMTRALDLELGDQRSRPKIATSFSGPEPASHSFPEPEFLPLSKERFES